MPRFFIRQNQIENDLIHIVGEDAHHIARSLRMAQGEKIEVVDMQSNLYNCTLVEFIQDKEVVAKIDSQEKCDTEPSHKITLYQALPKSDKMETIIQKSVECGVFEIVPFNSERCIAKLDKKDSDKKIARWQKIAEGASKQSGRGLIPQVKEVLSFAQMIEDAKKKDLVLFCYEAENGETIKNALSQVKPTDTIALIVGSEGGFSIKEAEQIKQNGIKSVGLGKRILRCETAPAFALACIMYETEL